MYDLILQDAFLQLPIIPLFYIGSQQNLEPRKAIVKVSRQKSYLTILYRKYTCIKLPSSKP